MSAATDLLGRSEEDARVLVIGADLLSEHGENPEYDRAIVEMATRLLGLDSDSYGDVLAAMRILNPEVPA